LKGHFQSLKELRNPINIEQQLEMVIAWAQCCIILHNMIICFEKARNIDSMDWATGEGGEFIPPEAEGVDDNGVGDNSYEGTAGQARRAHLMDQLFNSPYSGAQHEAE